MMAAGRAGSLGKRVLLLEKTRHLETSSLFLVVVVVISPMQRTISMYCSNGMVRQRFLFSPFSQFGVEDTFTFLLH